MGVLEDVIVPLIASRILQRHPEPYLSGVQRCQGPGDLEVLVVPQLGVQFPLLATRLKFRVVLKWEMDLEKGDVAPRWSDELSCNLELVMDALRGFGFDERIRITQYQAYDQRHSPPPETLNQSEIEDIVPGALWQWIFENDCHRSSIEDLSAPASETQNAAASFQKPTGIRDILTSFYQGGFQELSMLALTEFDMSSGFADHRVKSVAFDHEMAALAKQWGELEDNKGGSAGVTKTNLAEYQKLLADFYERSQPFELVAAYISYKGLAQREAEKKGGQEILGRLDSLQKLRKPLSIGGAASGQGHTSSRSSYIVIIPKEQSGPLIFDPISDLTIGSVARGENSLRIKTEREDDECSVPKLVMHGEDGQEFRVAFFDAQEAIVRLDHKQWADVICVVLGHQKPSAQLKIGFQGAGLRGEELKQSFLNWLHDIRNRMSVIRPYWCDFLPSQQPGSSPRMAEPDSFLPQWVERICKEDPFATQQVQRMVDIIPFRGGPVANNAQGLTRFRECLLTAIKQANNKRGIDYDRS